MLGTESQSGYARILRRRNSGGVIFCTVRWAGKEVQLVCERAGTAGFSDVRSCPLGSILHFTGTWTHTRSGARSIRVNRAAVQATCGLGLPDKYHGQDPAKRYANRTLDLISSQDTFDFFAFISRAIGRLRMELFARSYQEFITGTLQEEFEGGLAASFSTEAKFNNRQYHLSLTSELKLKRLIMAGFERVFEIAQTFRNEGINPICSPEHTLLEVYEVGRTCNDMMDLLEALVRAIASEYLSIADGAIPFVARQGGRHALDFASPFDRITFADAYRTYVDPSGAPCTIENLVTRYPNAFALDMHRYTWLMKVIESLLCIHIIQPTFLTDLPHGMSPFVKAKVGEPGTSDRAFLIAGGLFLADLYTDEDDVGILRSALAEQRGEISDNPHNFANLLAFGMPPTAGLGLGLRRLFLLFRGELPFNIKETILYPL